jgi:glycosyltransferase involved in cell wall biosynthesis
MESRSLKIAYLTAGAAGMFCGSCMHDNTLAKALIALGCDVQLIPLYTPIRTDEASIATQPIFFGGINVYLQQRFPWFRYVPRWLDRVLDQPWILRWATSRGMQTQASELGALAVSILKGEAGNQQKEVERLGDWLEHHERPQVLVFTNMLVAGCLPRLKERLKIPAVVTLQGDDIFLRDLIAPYQSQAFTEIQRLVSAVDGFIVNSAYYADFMSDYFHAPREKFHIVPLGIDVTDFAATPAVEKKRPPTIGYLARLAPEKGLHVLVDAFVHLHRQLGAHEVQLRLAGWLGKQHEAYAMEQFEKLRAAGLADHFSYAGEVTRSGKIDFLNSIDVLSVPTTYREPKGLFVLEALARGVPVIQPDHGAFPELLAGTGGGVLFPAQNATALAEQLFTLLRDEPRRRALGMQGQQTVHAHYSAPVMAARTLEVLRNYAG